LCKTFTISSISAFLGRNQSSGAASRYCFIVSLPLCQTPGKTFSLSVSVLFSTSSPCIG
jgi:hypothetical protein